MASNQTQVVKDPMQQEEEKLEDALNHLNQLHVQLRELRSALPRMLEPLRAKQPSPEAMYATFLHSYTETQKELDSFRDAWSSQESRMAMVKAQECLKRSPKVKQWRATDDPTWAEPDPKRVKSG
ncbi:hypothetical protein QBC43DRAFT_311282 [Cladorrhinum sp. PSN259]|nr:hypothetical protein QBC43DRAFT_311282 [Cladorrhinum sp. PSN259]